MTENLPNPANTSGPQAPFPRDPLEITPQEIIHANYEDVTEALSLGLELTYNMQAQPNTEATKRHWNAIEAQVNDAGNMVTQWLSSNQRLEREGQAQEPFDSFVVGLSNKFITSGREVPENLKNALQLVRGDNTDFYRGLVRDAIYNRKAESLGLAEQSHPTESVASNPTEKAKQEAEQQNAVSQARESVEQAHGIEVFDDVVKFGKNKTSIETDVPNYGFKSVGDLPSKRDLTGSLQSAVKSVEKADWRDWRKHLHEAVGFTDVVESEKREETIPHVEKGRFGRTKSVPEKIMVSVPGSEHPVLMRNEQTGQDEPTVRFQYQFGFSDAAVSAAHQGELPHYEEINGARSGNHLRVGLDLPKSVADKLKGQIQQDPVSVRSLVEKLVLENNDGSITEQYWNNGTERLGHPIKPPYDKLPTDWTIDVVSGTQGFEANYQVERLPLK